MDCSIPSHDNVLGHNSFKDFARPGEIGELVPEGAGIVILGADDVQICDKPWSSWPDLSRRAYWQIVHFIISKLG